MAGEPFEWQEFRGLAADGVHIIGGGTISASEAGVQLHHCPSAAFPPCVARSLAKFLIEAADHAVACGCPERPVSQ